MNSARVLVVDDSKLARGSLRRILEPLGYEVLEAEDGMGALEQYFIEKPDVVLLDLVMHGMHGLEVIRKLRQLDPSARVVVASADIQTSSRQLAQEAGASGFVEKPFDAARVAVALEEVMRGGRSWN
jgi:two-component system, chemotaxis family, chemotaxis protein CheY